MVGETRAGPQIKHSAWSGAWTLGAQATGFTSQPGHVTQDT